MPPCLRRPALASIALLALAGCALRIADRSVEPPLAPDPVLQRLVDPRPAPTGPSWLGGDVASSVELADGRIVWLFGDTLLGTVRADCSPPAPYCDRDVFDDEEDGMIASSLALMRRAADGAPQPIEPFWPRASGVSEAALPSRRPGEFLWPMSVARVGETLLVTASRHTRERGLHSLGSVVLRVRNVDDPPAAWRWETWEVDASHPAERDRPQLTWMTALVPDGTSVYLFGERAWPPVSETLLARFAVADVDRDTWAPRLEFLEEPGDRWAARYDASRAWVLPGLPGTTEASVFHHPRLGWYSFRILPFTFAIRLYTAERLAGPWEDRGEVHRLPARWSEPRRPDGGPRYTAYAVKAHPWLGDERGIVLTYNVNLLDGTYESAAAAAERTPGFYVPQMVRVAPWRR